VTLPLAVAAAAIVGLIVGLGSRGWTDTQAGRPTPAWIHATFGAVLAGTAAWRFGVTWELPVFGYFALLTGPLTIIDLRAHRLPNPLTLSAYPIVVAGLLVPAIADDRLAELGRALIGGGILLAFYAVLHLVNPSGMGLGDVKLSGPMGALLAWLSWPVLLAGGFLGFALGAVAGIALLLARRAGRKSALPFGPFMLAGAWIAILASEPISASGILP
jgi:leader peptidase (prepilin peptidase)/N-methyltransferase